MSSSGDVRRTGVDHFGQEKWETAGMVGHFLLATQTALWRLTTPRSSTGTGLDMLTLRHPVGYAGA